MLDIERMLTIKNPAYHKRGSGPNGTRTRVFGLKGQRPRPLDDGANNAGKCIRCRVQSQGLFKIFLKIHRVIAPILPELHRALVALNHGSPLPHKIEQNAAYRHRGKVPTFRAEP